MVVACAAIHLALPTAKLLLITESSADAPPTRLRRKVLGNPQIPDFIRTVRGVGYCLDSAALRNESKAVVQ